MCSVGMLCLLSCVVFIFGRISVVHRICDMKSICVIYMSLVICRWNIVSEGYVKKKDMCTRGRVCVCIVCDYCVLGSISFVHWVWII